MIWEQVLCCLQAIRSMYRLILSKFHLLSPSFVFDSFGFKLSLFVILTNFSHSSNSSKLPARENLLFYSKIFPFPESVDSFFSGIYQISFICQLCQETKYLLRTFSPYYCTTKCRYISYLAKHFRENKNLTCRKCTTQSCQSLRTSYQETPNILLIQINRFSVSNLLGRPRKNNHAFGIYENIKLGLINYTLLGLIEHYGVFINSGHYVSYIRQNNKWYHCDDKHITETNLLTLSNNDLVFYAKEIDIGT